MTLYEWDVIGVTSALSTVLLGIEAMILTIIGVCILKSGSIGKRKEMPISLKFHRRKRFKICWRQKQQWTRVDFDAGRGLSESPG